MSSLKSIKSINSWHVVLLVCLFFLLAIGLARGEVCGDFIYNERIVMEKLFRNFCDQYGLDREIVYRVLSDDRVYIDPLVYEKRKKKGSGYFSKKFDLLNYQILRVSKELILTKQDKWKMWENTFKVDKETVLSIYRIESANGGNTGSCLVIRGIYTMALTTKDEAKADWFIKEIGWFLKYCQEKKLDPFTVLGSYAGALGKGQFMPSSYFKFAVDGNGDGIVDLNNEDDVLASIAYYLLMNGYKKHDMKSQDNAIFNYNRQKAYVKAVKAYRQVLKKRSS